MDTRVDELYDYVQERCLWQFASRTWDREENIDGVLGKTTQMLLGQTPAAETPVERCQLADAKVVVADFRSRFPWIKDVSEEEIKELMQGLKARLTDIAITHSKNHELNHSLY